MKTLDRSDIPEDFTYYRSGSRVFYEYYKKYTKMIVFRIGKWYEFIKAWRIIGNIYRVNVEKIDQEPTVEKVRKQGTKHGVIWWWPMHKKEKPKGWFRLPTFLAKENFHSSRSAFSILDREDYWNKWVPSARAHRRKVHGLIEKWVLRIEQTLDMNVYLEAYKKTKVPDPFKSWLIRWSEGVRDLKLEENTRIYVACSVAESSLHLKNFSIIMVLRILSRKRENFVRENIQSFQQVSYSSYHILHEVCGSYRSQ